MKATVNRFYMGLLLLKGRRVTASALQSRLENACGMVYYTSYPICTYTTPSFLLISQPLLLVGQLRATQEDKAIVSGLYLTNLTYVCRSKPNSCCNPIKTYSQWTKHVGGAKEGIQPAALCIKVKMYLRAQQEECDKHKSVLFFSFFLFLLVFIVQVLVFFGTFLLAF